MTSKNIKWKKIYHFDVVGSTNDEAIKLAQAGAPDGTSVVAGEQTCGRGKINRAWYSPKDAGIYLSIIKRPKRKIKDLTEFTVKTAQKVSQVINEITKLKTTIEWPNDLILGDQKYGGVLCEASTKEAKLNYFIIGIGVNVNNQTFPENLKITTTSLSLHLKGKELNKEKIIKAIIEEINV